MVQEGSRYAVEVRVRNPGSVIPITITCTLTSVQYFVRGNTGRHTHHCKVKSAAPDPKPVNNVARNTVQFVVGVDGDGDVDKDDPHACRQYLGMEVSDGNTEQELCDIDGN